MSLMKLSSCLLLVAGVVEAQEEAVQEESAAFQAFR
jgi:hypothetical protein